MSDNLENLPPFLAEQVAAAYDAETAARIASGYTEAAGRPVTFRANTLKASGDDVAAALEAAGIRAERVGWYPDAFVAEGIRERDLWGLEIYRAGGIYLQSLSSMLPPIALSPRPGADVLDMCAAPGGKTSQISALTGGGARITACELNGPRAEKLAYNMQKLGVGNLQIMRTDARRLDEFFSFDQVLIDAPCSGTGTYRMGDERAAARMTGKLLEKVLKSQRALLDRALTVLKPGGTLVYSTCSILPCENGRAVIEALRRHRDCEVVPLDMGGAFDLPVLPGEVEGTLTVAPTRLFEGFYIALIKKG